MRITASLCAQVALLLLATAAGLQAQQGTDAPISVTAGFSSSEYVSAQQPIELTFNRLPSAAEGRIAIVVGTADLTSLFEAAGTKLVFRPSGVNLPAGESQLKVFLVTGAAWNELATIGIRVLTPTGFEKAVIDPGVELRNTGQIREGVSGSQPPSLRPTYQNLGGTFSLETNHQRNGLSLTSSTHLLGADQRRNALRFGEKGDAASRIDLADYAVHLQRGNTVLSLGQVSAGTNRHLINGFASRGLTLVTGGSRVSWSAGAENGTNIVGTDNIFGLARPNHRILSSGLALELLPARPGALHVDATVLHGSVEAVSGFNQNGLPSADQSDGYGMQVAASTPTQRVRFAGGIARSRSQYAADAPSSSGSSSTPPQAHTQNARYAELNVGLVQNHKVLAVPVSLDLSLRHERVDPLYRSVATFVQSDIERDGIDAGGNLGVVTVRVGGGRTADNLKNVATLMRNRGRSSSLTLATPLAALLRVTQHAQWLPTLSYALQQMHQFGDGIPTGFTASDIPDMLSTVHDGSAQWQVKQWQLAYHLNVSEQDNRQPGRELADFGAVTNGVSVGVLVRTTLSLGLDLGLERQDNKQFALTNRVRRAGLTSNWRITPVTTLDAALTLSRTVDAGAASNTHVGSVEAGIARGFNLWRNSEQTPRGQVFLRFSRYSNDVFSLNTSLSSPPQLTGTWHIASGLTLRLF